MNLNKTLFLKGNKYIVQEIPNPSSELRNYRDGVDFIVVSYDLPKFDYVKLCIESINRYWEEIDHTIYIVVNYVDIEEIKYHIEYFSEQDNVVIVEGVDQSTSSRRSKEGSVRGTGMNTGLIDGCIVASGGRNGAIAFNTALKKGDRKYVCTIDRDAIFLSKEATKLIQLTSEYTFISNRWCPANVFPHVKSNKWEDGIARDNLFFSERKLYDEIESENYVERGVWKYSPRNCDYRDMTGNITWYAKQKGHNWLVLKNSYRDRFRVDNGLWKEHLLNIPYGEQCWLDDIPIFFHATRGGYRNTDALKLWVTEVENYFKIKK